MSKYHFFWGGPLSQWFSCEFEIDGIEYNCTEQYMMSQKAILFGDDESHKKIMATHSPLEQKAFGREVKGFTPVVWEYLISNIGDSTVPLCMDIVYRANRAKFTQDEKLKEYLLSLSDSVLVEASPDDRIWGIGRGEDDPLIHDESKWLGTNWLGIVLTNLKLHLGTLELCERLAKSSGDYNEVTELLNKR